MLLKTAQNHDTQRIYDKTLSGKRIYSTQALKLYTSSAAMLITFSMCALNIFVLLNIFGFLGSVLVNKPTVKCIEGEMQRGWGSVAV